MNNVVGYNPEELDALLDTIGSSYMKANSYVNGAFNNLATIIFFGETNGFGGWYAPDAVEFEKKFFEPLQRQMRNDVNRTYKAIYEPALSAANAWNKATGNNRTWAKIGFNAQFVYEYKAKPKDSNGNIRIHPDMLIRIKQRKTEVVKQYSMYLDDSLEYLKQHSVFLGEHQQEVFVNAITKLNDRLKNKSIELYDEAINALNTSIEKYRLIAKQIAGSFDVVTKSVNTVMNTVSDVFK